MNVMSNDVRVILGNLEVQDFYKKICTPFMD